MIPYVVYHIILLWLRAVDITCHFLVGDSSDFRTQNAQRFFTTRSFLFPFGILRVLLFFKITYKTLVPMYFTIIYSGYLLGFHPNQTLGH